MIRFAAHVLASLAFVSLVASAEAPAAEGDLEEIRSCVRANIPSNARVQKLALRSVDRTGGDRTMKGRLYWKRSPSGLSNTLMEIEAPPSDRGSAYLMRQGEKGPETFVYLPELQRVRRIHPRSASGSLFGTDFTFEDIQRIQQISASPSAERLADTTHAGREVAVIRVPMPPDELSAYDRLVYFVDKESCVPLRIEFYEAGDRLLKELEADATTLEQQGDTWIATAMHIKDLKNETETHLSVGKLEVDEEISERIFSLQRLERRGH